MENIYSQLIGVIQKLTSWMLNITKFLKNISVHIYWSLITVIMQLSLIIAFCGMLIHTLLITAGLTIESKLLIGMQKITIWLQRIAIKCSMKWKKNDR